LITAMSGGLWRSYGSLVIAQCGLRKNI